MVLVLRSDFQTGVLEKFGTRFFLVTEHNRGMYQFTMLVVTDMGKGVPVAFSVSNRAGLLLQPYHHACHHFS